MSLAVDYISTIMLLFLDVVTRFGSTGFVRTDTVEYHNAGFGMEVAPAAVKNPQRSTLCLTRPDETLLGYLVKYASNVNAAITWCVYNRTRVTCYAGRCHETQTYN